MSGLGAAPERDAGFRRRAQLLARQLQIFVKDMATHAEPIRQLAANDYAVAEFPLPAGFMAGVGLPATMLTIQVGPTVEGIGAAFNPQDNTLHLPILPHVDWPKLIAGETHLDPRKRASAKEFVQRLQGHIDAWFNRYQSFIVHELTHMFDHMRAKGAMRIVSATPRDRYMNDPAERNAFFQEMITQLEERVSALPRAAQILVVDDFYAFENQAMSTAAYRESWPHLTENARRRLRSRLWQTWKHLRDEAEGTP